MTRHGRNATASAVYSYHEKKKDTATSGYGSKSVRLGKDSIKGFDCCCLTLQPCRTPVLTGDGYLYDKEAILECLLHQKRENARKMKEYEKQKRKEQTELEELGQAEAKSKVQKFLSTETSIATKPMDSFKKQQPAQESVPASSSGETSGSSKKLPSFWVPSLTPDAKSTLIEKPDMKTYCPMSGKPLRVKDLIAVKFTPIADRDDKTNPIVKASRYMCAVTRDVLGNSVPCAVLRPTGDVVTMECVESLIKKDMLCPITGKKLNERDIIPIVRGGTGFAASGVDLKATKAGPALMA